MNESGINELLQFCRSDSLSEYGLRKIIERHGLTKKNFRPSHQAGDNLFLRAACFNARVNEGIIGCLLEYFPAAASDANGHILLHYACSNKNMTLNIIQLLIDTAPDSVRSVDIKGWMPLHCLCMNEELDEAAAMKILKLLIERHQDAVRHVDNNGCLSIHCAAGAGGRSPEFCHVLIEAYPGSERIVNHEGALPLHYACRYARSRNAVATVEYLYKLHPSAINHTTTSGLYPIHYAILGLCRRMDPIVAAEIVKFLLVCDLNVAQQMLEGRSPLQWTCCLGNYNDFNIEAGIEAIKAIYDAHPEAIEGNSFVSSIRGRHQQVQRFLYRQLVYACQAKDHRLLTTPDINGQLPLHKALQNNVRLGSIKLLVKGNPPALQTIDNSGAMPLHVACHHHDSADVINYLVRLDTTTLDAVDTEGNTALHYACGGAKYDTIALLMETYDAVSVSKRNAHGKLPIDLLWESDEVLDRDSVEYTESVFRLLTVHPETLMNVDMKQPTDADATQNGKKRKLDAVEK